jgi:hypothetical protein
MKKKQSFSWEGLGILLGILFLPLMIVKEAIRLSDRDRRRRSRHSGVMIR